MNTLTPNADALESRRKRRLMVLCLLCLLGAAGYGLYWFLVARFHVDTDNAYVQGNVVQITPQESGTVVDVSVNDTDAVKMGQILVQLDTVDARTALDQAEAQLAQTVREVRSTYATNDALSAAISVRRADLARSETELNRLRADHARREALAADGAVSGEELQHLKSSVASAQSQNAAAAASLAESEQQLTKNETLTDGTTVETHPRVLAAAAKYRQAWIAFKRSEIVAPVAGTVARRNIQVGQRVATGTPIMAIVPLDQLWVDANFKESQLANLRIGQKALLTADIYGQRTEYHGHIVGLGAGTGSAFSLLPAQNATGNWIKIVQRVPVRIALDAKDLAEHPLRVGLSMEVNVDVRDQSGPSLTESSSVGPAATTSVFNNLDSEADERVNTIVSTNLGRKVQLKRAG